MPHVTVRINNRSYDIACGAGEEDRLRALAAEVDGCVGELRRQIGSAPEAMLLLLSSLTMADKAREAVAAADPARRELEEARAALVAARAEADSMRAELLDARAAISAIETRLMDMTVGDDQTGDDAPESARAEPDGSPDGRSPLEDLFSGIETRIETISRKIAAA